jgi:hypothetical protein
MKNESTLACFVTCIYSCDHHMHELHLNFHESVGPGKLSRGSPSRSMILFPICVKWSDQQVSPGPEAGTRGFSDSSVHLIWGERSRYKTHGLGGMFCSEPNLLTWSSNLFPHFPWLYARVGSTAQPLLQTRRLFSLKSLKSSLKAHQEFFILPSLHCLWTPHL